MNFRDDIVALAVDDWVNVDSAVKELNLCLQLFATSDAAQKELLVAIYHFSASREDIFSLVVNLEPSLSLENVSQPVV